MIRASGSVYRIRAILFAAAAAARGAAACQSAAQQSTARQTAHAADGAGPIRRGAGSELRLEGVRGSCRRRA